MILLHFLYNCICIANIVLVMNHFCICFSDSCDASSVMHYLWVAMFLPCASSRQGREHRHLCSHFVSLGGQVFPRPPVWAISLLVASPITSGRLMPCRLPHVRVTSWHHVFMLEVTTAVGDFRFLGRRGSHTRCACMAAIASLCLSGKGAGITSTCGLFQSALLIKDTIKSLGWRLIWRWSLHIPPGWSEPS